MPAVSKKQQKFFGIVRAIQKGEMASTTPETAKVANDMKKKDVKDIASTKHKGLPEKKRVKEEKNFKSRDKILKKVKQIHKHLFKNLHKGDTSGDVNETMYYKDDPKYRKRIKDNDQYIEKRNAEMVHGKKKITKSGKNWKQFSKDVLSAKDRMKKGEVKRYDSNLKRWVSIKD